jgi:hypothetical protein
MTIYYTDILSMYWVYTCVVLYLDITDYIDFMP